MLNAYYDTLEKKKKMKIQIYIILKTKSPDFTSKLVMSTLKNEFFLKKINFHFLLDVRKLFFHATI